MNSVVVHIKWIMLVCGVLTLTMIQGAFAPHRALNAAFGTALEGPLAEIIVRNWAALIALVGAVLVYGAFNPPNRKLALVLACVSKLTFVALVLTYGREFLGHQAGVFVAADLVMVALFAAYLVATRAAAAPQGAKR